MSTPKITKRVATRTIKAKFPILPSSGRRGLVLVFPSLTSKAFCRYPWLECSPHKLTTRLVRERDVIVREDLNVAGTIRNRRLARHLAGLGMAEFRRQIQ
jgi:hypothetical protein